MLPNKPLHIAWAQKTDIGIKRLKNEDAIGVFETPNGLLFLLCDGMGGHLGGATAAKMGIEGMHKFFNKKKYFRPVNDLFKSAVEETHEALCSKIEKEEALKGMGTTLVAVLVADGQLHHAHIGDSRLYLLREGVLEQLTEDHSFVQNMVNQGAISAEEAGKHPRRNEILRALGDSSHTPQLSAAPITLFPGDVFMICSDGLHATVGQAEILGVLKNPNIKTLEAQADALIDLANQKGGNDNVSVQILAVSENTASDPIQKTTWFQKLWPF